MGYVGPMGQSFILICWPKGAGIRIVEERFERMAAWMAIKIGSPWMFAFIGLISLGALIASLAWPEQRLEINAWAGAIGTYTTGLALVVNQNSQNRQAAASNIKDDAVIQATEAISDELIGLECKPSKEIEEVKNRLTNLPK